MVGLVDVFILTVVFSVTLADLYFVWSPEPTVSNRMREHGLQQGVLPFAWGVLGGHFWGPSRAPLLGSWPVSIAALLACVGLMYALHRGLRRYIHLPRWIPLLYLLPGVAVGAFLWPQ